MKILRSSTLLPLVITLLALELTCSPVSLAKEDHGLTVMLRISRLEQALGLVDQIFQGDNTQKSPSPTAMLRGMLQGTSWIDDQRAIVFGVDTSGDNPVAAALVPFLEPNDDFKKSFNAIQGQNYYLVGLPPGKSVELTPESRKVLEQASTLPNQPLITLELAPARLIRQNKDKIAQQMLKLDTMPAGNSKTNGTMGPRDLKEILQGLIQVTEQLNKLTFALDLDAEDLTWMLDAEALPQTEAAQLFTIQPHSWRMAGMEPKRHLSFACQAFNLESLLNLLSPLMEPIYRKNGINFSKLELLARTFTGEMAGGVSFTGNDLEAETIAVLKDPANASRFIQEIYLPWIEEYMDSIQNLLKQQGINIDNKLLVRTTDSKVRGLPVYGMEIRMPMLNRPMDASKNGPADTSSMQIINYPFRMTVVNDMFVSAPNDARLAELIYKARRARKAAPPDWLARYQIDLQAYLTYIANLLPFQDLLPPIPHNLGNSVSTIRLNNGKLASKTVIAVKDLKTMVGFFKQIGKAAAAETDMAGKQPAGKTSSPQPEKPLTAADLVDKGSLFATYGNYKAAIAYYKKAISKNPSSSEAYFNLGLAYGELEKLDQALKALDKAIQLMPDRAVYYYGRARILLLAGRNHEARADFEKAAIMGNPDAKQYLAEQGDN